MIVNFGWMKETTPVAPLFRSYCYHCSNTVTWHVWREKEWVMFFGAKSFPFFWKNFAVCPGCEFAHHVTWGQYLKIADPRIRESISSRIEAVQLATKNETQVRFLLAQRAERRYDPAAVNRRRTTAYFEVESTLEVQGSAYVIARLLDDSDFELTEASSLGGCSIEKWLELPRATGPDGKPRYDVFAFRLKSTADRTRFSAGQNVKLEA